MVAHIVPGIEIRSFGSAMIAIIAISLVNSLIKPVFTLVTLPITILSLGLFTVIINAVMFLLAAYVTPGFYIYGFWAAILGSLLYSFLSTLLRYLIRND